MENIQHKSALIPSDEIRSEELLAEQKFEAFITSLAHIIEKYGMYVVGIEWSGVSIVNIRQC